jgi:hypothetical protein
VTDTDTVAVAVPPWPSLIVYVKLSGPQDPAFDVYVTVLLGLIVTTPLEPWVTDATVNVSLSGSLSFARTETVTLAPDEVLAESSTAMGAWFCGTELFENVIVTSFTIGL